MYLAGLIADEKEITPEQLNAWVEGAYWYMLSEYTVAWIAAESRYGWELALKWIESDREHIAAAGWSTLSNLVSITEDAQLDIRKLEELLMRAESGIHQSQNRVRYAMNGFVIAMGSYVSEMKGKAETVAASIGKVSVEMGGTACKVPLATDYIKKVADRGKTGRKRKMARC
jgi:hypothetical protein